MLLYGNQTYRGLCCATCRWALSSASLAEVRLFETRLSRLWDGNSFVIQQFLWLNMMYDVQKIFLFHHTCDWESGKVQNVYSNLYSQAVTHPSTNRSQPCLTSVIGRELVYSRWYGRRHFRWEKNLVRWTQNGQVDVLRVQLWKTSALQRFHWKD